MGAPRRRPSTWETCLDCAHGIGAHQQPSGPCQIRSCDCPRFEWADEGPRVANFRLCLRWLWRVEAEIRPDGPGADRLGTLAALRVLAHSLGPARADQIVREEAERWEAQTGRSPRMTGFEEPLPSRITRVH